MGNEQRIEREYFTKAMQAMATNPEARRHMLDGLKNRKDAREILTDMLDTKKTKTGKTTYQTKPMIENGKLEGIMYSYGNISSSVDITKPENEWYRNTLERTFLEMAKPYTLVDRETKTGITVSGFNDMDPMSGTLAQITAMHLRELRERKPNAKLTVETDASLKAVPGSNAKGTYLDLLADDRPMFRAKSGTEQAKPPFDYVSGKNGTLDMAAFMECAKTGKDPSSAFMTQTRENPFDALTAYAKGYDGSDRTQSEAVPTQTLTKSDIAGAVRTMLKTQGESFRKTMERQTETGLPVFYMAKECLSGYKLQNREDGATCQIYPVENRRNGAVRGEIIGFGLVDNKAHKLKGLLDLRDPEAGNLQEEIRETMRENLKQTLEAKKKITIGSLYGTTEGRNGKSRDPMEGFQELRRSVGGYKQLFPDLKVTVETERMPRLEQIMEEGNGGYAIRQNGRATRNETLTPDGPKPLFDAMVDKNNGMVHDMTDAPKWTRLPKPKATPTIEDPGERVLDNVPKFDETETGMGQECEGTWA